MIKRNDRRLGALALCAAALASAGADAAQTGGVPKMKVTAQSHERRTLYHSPQTPGYTCWSGIWRMPDGGLMVTFTQATGLVAGWRPRAPAAVLRRMPTANQEIPGYDMTGLALENVYLRSMDAGKTWQKAGSDPFCSCMNGFWGGGIVPLPDGTLLRSAWGQSLPLYDLPATGFLQRSTDGARSWGAPEFISADPRLQTWPKRIRALRDGRLLMTGAACAYEPEDWTWMAQLPKVRPCFWVSQDPAGKAWSGPVTIAPPGVPYAGEEWDAAELENGDLLALIRTATYDAQGNTLSQERRQSVLAKRGETWDPGPVAGAPFPHSGQPELLRTREGVVLNVASNGIWWTADRGATWSKLDVPGTAYYPYSVQADDGTILVVSHVGSDDPYGKVDQSIVLDTFRITVAKDRAGR